MDESRRREAQAVVETSYDEKVSGTCKSVQLGELREQGGGRGRSLAARQAPHSPCCLANTHTHTNTVVL